MTKTIIASGYFDPLHVGHIEYLNMAASLYRDCRLVVIVNNDKQCMLKKGKIFQPQDDRLIIVRNLKPVFRAFLALDEDRTVCRSIRDIHNAFGDCVFAKGGDRFAGEIPEAAVCLELGIDIVDGLGEKIRSSSKIKKNE